MLEIGCGIGRIGLDLAPLCRSWTGAGISANMLRYARERLQGVPNIRLEQLCGGSLDAFDGESFDAVYVTNMLAHLDEIDRWWYVREAFRVLRPGGRIFLDTIDVSSGAGEMCPQESTTPSMMVNRSFASTYFNGGSVIGKHLGQPSSMYFPNALVRGIVGDAREQGLDHEPVPTIYYCSLIMQPGLYFLERTHGDPMALGGSIRRKLHEIEPSRSVYDISPLTAHLSDAYAENRLRTVLLAFFALSAISLACVGLYGTLSGLVNIRQREVGLRLALGAMRVQIVRQFLGQGMRVAVAGCAAGLGLAGAFTRILAGMLFGVPAWDAITMTGVTALVIVVSMAASLVPAMRAARVEPMQVLREE